MQQPGKNRIGIYEKALPASLGWEERLVQAAAAGYDFVEMSIDDSQERLARLQWSAAERKILHRAIEHTGVPVLTMGVSGHRKYPLGSSDQQVRQRALEILRQSIGLASDLGVRIIQLMGYDVFYEPSDADTRGRFLDGLFQGARWAAAAGVMLALENVDVETVDSVEKALAYVREVNSPWLNLYPDMGNLAAAGFDPVQQFKLGAGFLVGIHVKDALPGEVRGVAFGQGIVPFAAVFEALAGMDFSGPMVIEMWAHLDKTGDPLKAAADARNFVNRLTQATAARTPGG